MLKFIFYQIYLIKVANRLEIQTYLCYYKINLRKEADCYD